MAEAFGISMTAILTAYITEKIDEYDLKRNNNADGITGGKAGEDCK